MKENSILSQGYCLCSLQENLCFPSAYQGKVPKRRQPQWMRQSAVLRKRENPFCVDVTFLLVYTLLSKEGFYLWQREISAKAKQQWKKLYYRSEYNNSRYEAFFDMRQAAELDWLTGIFIKIRQGGVKEYWKIINGIAGIFPEEQRFMERREHLGLEELLRKVWREENAILQAGRLLILLILAEFYQVHVSRKDWWSEVDGMVLRGMSCYQGYHREKNSNKQPKRCLQVVEDSLWSQGIHPLRLQKYPVAPKELPKYQAVQPEDWKDMWNVILALEKCICEDTRIYKKLKEQDSKN